MDFERSYLDLFEALPCAAAYHQMIFDPDGLPIDYIFLRVNKAFEELTGLSRENLIGRRIKEVLPNTEEIWFHIYGEVCSKCSTKSVSHYSKELGRHYYVKAYSNKQGYFYSLFEDITPVLKKEEEIKNRDETIHNILENTPLSILLLNKEGKIVGINAEAREMAKKDSKKLHIGFGDFYNCQAALQSTACGMGDDCQECPLRKRFFAVIEQGERVKDFEFNMQQIRDNKIIQKNLRIDIGPLHFATGEELLQVSIKDLSEHHSLEEKKNELESMLMLQSKVNSLGDMAAALIHEINNPLTVIKAYSEMALAEAEEYQMPPKLLRKIKAMSSTSQTIADYIRSAKNNFIGAQSLETRADLHLVTEDMLSLLEKIFMKENIKIELNLKARNFTLGNSPTEIQQILMNLLSNAQQSLSKTNQASKKIKIESYDTEDQRIYEFSDNGPGMPAEQAQFAFNKFFSLKPEQQGSGIGLYLVKTFVEKSGGEVSIQSALQKGCHFKFAWPLIS